MERLIGIIIICSTLLAMAFIIDFRMNKDDAPIQQVVKKVVVVKKIYIKVPSDSNRVVVDTIQLVTPKANPNLEMQNYRRSRFMHKKGSVG